MLLVLLRIQAPVTPPRTYPLAGLAQTYPLTAQQTYPLNGVRPTYPLQ